MTRITKPLRPGLLPDAWPERDDAEPFDRIGGVDDEPDRPQTSVSLPMDPTAEAIARCPDATRYMCDCGMVIVDAARTPNETLCVVAVDGERYDAVRGAAWILHISCRRCNRAVLIDSAALRVPK